jgi:hypothetical protein
MPNSPKDKKRRKERALQRKAEMRKQNANLPSVHEPHPTHYDAPRR